MDSEYDKLRNEAEDSMNTDNSSVAQIIYLFVPHLSIYTVIATNMLYNDAFMINSLVML
jgi:hypothetical protein